MTKLALIAFYKYRDSSIRNKCRAAINLALIRATSHSANNKTRKEYFLVVSTRGKVVRIKKTCLRIRGTYHLVLKDSRLLRPISRSTITTSTRWCRPPLLNRPTTPRIRLSHSKSKRSSHKRYRVLLSLIDRACELLVTCSTLIATMVKTR